MRWKIVGLSVGILALSALFSRYQQEAPPELPDARIKVYKQPIELPVAELSQATLKRQRARAQLQALKRAKKTDEPSRKQMALLQKQLELYKRLEDYELKLNLHLDDTDFDAAALRKQILQLQQSARKLRP